MPYDLELRVCHIREPVWDLQLESFQLGTAHRDRDL